MQYASNAVLAKARAMYAGHITDSEYAELAACKSLSELLSKLKRRKRYAEALEKVPANITSTQAEQLLRLSVFDQLRVLSRYEKSGRKDFYKYYIVKNDIFQILRCVRLLTVGIREEFLPAMPPFFGRMSELDLVALSEVDSFPSLLNALNGTPYRKLLEPFLPVWGQEDIYLHIEAACNRYLCTCLSEIVRHDKSDEKQVDKVFSLYFDSEWIIALYRMKKLRVRDEETVIGFLAEEYTNFTKAQIKTLTGAEDEKALMAALADTVYAEAFSGILYGDTEVIITDFVLRKYVKDLRFYSDPAAMVFCYMYLAENEIANIIRIIEGIRYGVSAEQILAALTGVTHAA